MNMKNPNFAAQMSGQVRATSPGNSGFPNLYAGGSGVIVSSTGTRHLSPVPFNSVVNRHGSMPNVSYQFSYYSTKTKYFIGFLSYTFDLKKFPAIHLCNVINH